MANAPFPHPDAQVIGADQMRELNIGALRKQRVMREFRAEGPEIDGVGVLDEEGAMGIAHACRDRIAINRQVQSVGRTFQRDSGPAHHWRTHIHRGHPVALIPRG